MSYKFYRILGKLGKTEFSEFMDELTVLYSERNYSLNAHHFCDYLSDEDVLFFSIKYPIKFHEVKCPDF